MTRAMILMVEDNADDEALTLRALDKYHSSYDVIVLRDGAEALDYLLAPEAELPQLTLLDLKLPKIDGLEVLRRVRSNTRTSHLPIVILTSSDEERDIVESYRLRVNSYIRKPVDFDHFCEAVRQVGTYWLTLNQAPPR